MISASIEVPKINFLREEGGKEWIFEIKRNHTQENIRVQIDFSAYQECIKEGYQIFYPVDAACDEPSVYESEITIDEVYLIELDEDGEESDCEDGYLLESIEEEIITNYILDNYEF